MNYAWEAILMAELNGRERDSLRFVEADTPSPYIEVSVTDLNSREPEGDRVEINPLYRLGDVFGRLFDRDTDEMAQTRALFFDVCMHYIVQLDLREGLSKEDYYYSLISDDLQSGRYGWKAEHLPQECRPFPLCICIFCPKIYEQLIHCLIILIDQRICIDACHCPSEFLLVTACL